MTPIKAVQSPYYGGDAAYRTPPPDLPSLLLKERIVYLGLPLFSSDDANTHMADSLNGILPNANTQTFTLGCSIR